MKKQTLLTVGLLFLVPLLLSACLRVDTEIVVNADGSGILTVRTLAESSISAFVEQQDTLSAREGFELIEAKPISNDAGWKGTLMRYRFKQVEYVTCEDESFSDHTENADLTFRFRLEKGRRSVLIVSPEYDGVSFSQAIERQPQIRVRNPEQAASLMMMSTMAPMFRGARMSCVLKINGRVLEANADHRTGPETIMLIDIRMDELLADPSNVEQLTLGAVGIRNLARQGLTSFRMQNPMEPLEINFIP